MLLINSSMKVLIYLVFLISMAFGCKANDTFRELKSTQTYKIKIDNSNIESIGYKSYIDDMDIGVNSICKSDSLIYISDPYHNNIKAININTGIINTSQELFPWITDIFVYEDKICVVSEYDGLKVLNNDLTINQHINLPKGYKYFISFQNKMYLINATVFKTQESETTYQTFELKTIVKNAVVRETYLPFKSLPAKFGYFNDDKELNGKIYLEIGNTYYEIPNKLKQIEDYEAYNIFVDKDEIVYYYPEKNELIIYIYKYN